MHISIDQAQALCTVVDSGGYTQAAEKLHKSHSALIYLIKSLEKQCGFDLFDRKGYRNALTTRGRRVYNKCQDILKCVEELQDLCGKFEQGWEASLKIVYDGILPFNPFFQLHKKLQAQKIPTVIQTYTGYLEDVEDTFNHIKADIMISVIPIDKNSLSSVYLKPFKTYLVAHKDHPIHQKSQKWTADELSEFDFLTTRETGKRLGLTTDIFEKSASFFLSDFYAKKEAICKKTGFGWLPDHMIESELKSGSLIPIKWEKENTQKIQPIMYLNQSKKLGLTTDMIVDFLKSNF